MSITKFWPSKLFNLGDRDHFDELERTSNVLINQIQFMICVFLSIFSIKDFINASPDLRVTVVILLVMASFFLIRQKVSLMAASSIQIFICILATTIEYYTHNLQLRVEPLYVVILLLIVLLLPNNKAKYFFSGLLLFSFLVVVYAVKNFEVKIQADSTPVDNISIFVFAAMMVFVITMRYFHLLKRILGDQTNLLSVLKSKNKELERFAYITSHDLKQPIRNIGSFAGLLKRGINQPGREDKNIEYLQEIETSAGRMNTLIEEILSFSKIDKVSFVKKEVDLSLLISEYINSHSTFLVEKNATIEYSNLPIVSGNEIYLSLLFQNLIENGIKYNKSKNPLIEIKSVQRDEAIKIIVKDNGIGISDEFSSSIFEPFKRLHSIKNYEGTGLGLSICRKIVETHDGKIWLENSPNQVGTKFAFTLPI